jgi:hypothetical protein
MNENDFRYLEQIQVGDPVVQRISELWPMFEFISPGPIERMIVTDRIDDSTDDRVFDSIWAFSGEHMIEAKGFLTQDNIDVAPFAYSLIHLELTTRDVSFTPIRSRKSSRLFLRFVATCCESFRI